MRNIDFTPLSRSSIGFDRLLEGLEEAARAPERDAGCPPHNIKKIGAEGEQYIDDSTWSSRFARPVAPPTRISDDAADVDLAQRAPVTWANWRGTVYHGLPSKLYRLGQGDGGYLDSWARSVPRRVWTKRSTSPIAPGYPSKSRQRSTRLTSLTTTPKSSGC